MLPGILLSLRQAIDSSPASVILLCFQCRSSNSPCSFLLDYCSLSILMSSKVSPSLITTSGFFHSRKGIRTSIMTDIFDDSYKLPVNNVLWYMHGVTFIKS